jgi:hypothetical protein
MFVLCMYWELQKIEAIDKKGREGRSLNYSLGRSKVRIQVKKVRVMLSSYLCTIFNALAPPTGSDFQAGADRFNGGLKLGRGLG